MPIQVLIPVAIHEPDGTITRHRYRFGSLTPNELWSRWHSQTLFMDDLVTELIDDATNEVVELIDSSGWWTSLNGGRPLPWRCDVEGGA